MSEVYLLEPPTNGKVILHTTHGDLDVELWAKECPKACRNFLQLCADGYYDNTIFHRIIKDFIVQGGDPTTTGKGGESIYGNLSFPTEIHPRLKFRYRGLLALASLDADEADQTLPNRHGSQFFVTLARADFLNGKHTIFGKVTGHSLYNLLSIAESQCDPKTDRPMEPAPKILSTEILYSPLGDFQPRPGSIALKKQQLEELSQQETVKPQKVLRDTLSSKKSNLLSFDEEENEESMLNETTRNNKQLGPSLDRSQSSSSNPEGEEADQNFSSKQIESLRKLKARVAQNLQNPLKESQETPSDSDEEDSNKQSNKSSSDSEEEILEPVKTKELRKKNAEEICQLKAEILAFKKGEGTIKKEEREEERVQDADLLTEAERRRRLYINRSRQTSKRQRQQTTISKLNDFTKRLRESSIRQQSENEEQSIGDSANQQPNEVDTDYEDKNWLSGSGLKFSVDSARAYELDAAKDALVIYDPLANASKEEIEEKMRLIRIQRMKPSLKGLGK